MLTPPKFSLANALIDPLSLASYVSRVEWLNALFHLMLLVGAHFLIRALFHWNQTHLDICCPTAVAKTGSFAAAPRGWKLMRTVFRIAFPRALLLVWGVGLFYIIVFDFGAKEYLDRYFRGSDWVWRLPLVFATGITLNLFIGALRYASRRLREAALKDLGHWRDMLLVVGAELCQIALPQISVFVLLPALQLPKNFQTFLQQSITAFLIGAIGWSILLLGQIIEAKIRYTGRLKYASDDRRLRSMETQLAAIHRCFAFFVVLATLGSALMVFDKVRTIGTSLLTSAGVVGIIAGVAAQRSLQHLIAGFQLALTQPIMLGDEVEVEGEFGTVEEITFGFVSIRLGDLRRLILPITYFLEKPFRNWTRVSAESTTSFALSLDLHAPLDPIREKLNQLVESNPLWNQGTRSLEIGELRDTSMVVKVYLSAANPRAAAALKSQVQEQLLQYLLDLVAHGAVGIFPAGTPAPTLAAPEKAH